MKKTLLCLMIICNYAQAVTLQCTNSPLIEVPNSTLVVSNNDFNDSFLLNNTQILTIESVNGSTVKNIPVSLWLGQLTSVSFISQNSSTADSVDKQVNYDNIEYHSPDDGLKYKIDTAWVHHVYMSSLRANNLSVVIRNKETGSESFRISLDYSVITPGTAARWVLPDQKDIGEIRTGEIMNFTLPGPEGAMGRVRGLSAIGDKEIISVNGCGTGCSADIADGGLIEVMANAENGTPEGEYGLNVEATLLCD